MSLSCGEHNKPPKWKEVVGDIRGGGNNCYMYYSVNEVEYRIRFPKKYGSAQEGEKCFLRYNEYQPDEAKVFDWRLTYLPDEVTFKVNSNHLLYKSDTIQFKYHFLDDAIVPKVSLKREKIESLELDTFFDEYLELFSEQMNAANKTDPVWKAYNDYFKSYENIKYSFKMTNHYLGML
jgi:hypothetical protein